MSAALNLPPAELAQYQAGMHRAKAVRHVCFDCADCETLCARHAGRCAYCNGDSGAELVEQDTHVYADGVPAWVCRTCRDGQPPEEAPGRTEHD